MIFINEVCTTNRPILAQSLEEGSNSHSEIRDTAEPAKQKGSEYEEKIKKAVVNSILDNVNETKSEIAQREIYHSK